MSAANPAFDPAALLGQFDTIWNYHGPSHGPAHTKQMWDIRAEDWAGGLRTDADRKRRSDARVSATVDYLLQRGVLTPDSDVIDMGCGPGQFVKGFAPHVRHAAGSDLSPRMLEYAAGFCREAGYTNVSWQECDFREADPEKLGWKQRFDLVFTSITPAINGDGLDKLIAMSRKWCYNSCFVRFDDPFRDEMMQQLFHWTAPVTPGPFFHWFYALVNLLFLRGYLPEVTYYTEEKTDLLTPDDDTAAHLAESAARRLAGADPAELAPVILEYLKNRADADGLVKCPNSVTYGWALWDVTLRRPILE